MTGADILYFIPSSPGLSLLLWVVIIIAVLYLARTPAHRTIQAFGSMVEEGLRLAARSVLLGEERLRTRNREVMLAMGAQSAEHEIEREFQRIETAVRRDIGACPALQRKLQEEIGGLDEVYSSSTEPEPPSLQGWGDAASSVSKLPSVQPQVVSEILEDINASLERSHRESLREYRKAVSERNETLKKMMPHWRNLQRQVQQLEKTITGLLKRSKDIDGHMERYKELTARTDRGERILSSSAWSQFFIAAFVLAIAAGGAAINFHLIAYPMQEMVGGNSYVGPYKTADIAAMVIILVELAMGLYLMESLRITHLFPVIGSMDDRMRRRMIWVTFGILLVLACVESALAFMRDVMAADNHALVQALSEAPAVAPANRWIPTVGQMVMGFIFPFALMFAAIPLESFVHSSRVVFGIALAGMLRGLAFLLRLSSSLARQFAHLMVCFYDLIVFVPLWVERFIRQRSNRGFAGREGARS